MTLYKCVECSEIVKPDWVGTSEITHIPKTFISPTDVICVDCYTEECMSHPDFYNEKYENEYEIQRDY